MRVLAVQVFLVPPDHELTGRDADIPAPKEVNS